jgi:hypothetical protein
MLKSRFIEFPTGLFTATPETYAERIVPLVVSTDLDAVSGTLFDQKGNAILTSPRLTDASYRKAFIAASEALVARAGVRLS